MMPLANGLNLSNVPTIARATRASGSFDPTAYGTVLVYEEARLLTGFSDGDSVGDDFNETGSGSDATQGTMAAQPIFKTNIINGHPALLFDGSRSLSGTVSISGTALTAVVVGILNNAGSAYGRFLSLTAGGSDFGSATVCDALSRNNGGASLLAYRNSAALSSAPVTYGTPFIAFSKFDGTNNTLWVNGSAQTPAASSGTFGITGYNIGFDPGDSSGALAGYLAALILYAGAISDANLSALYAALGTGVYGL